MIEFLRFLDKKAEKNQQNTELEAETVPQSQTINPKPETSNATDKSQSRSGINLFGSSPPPDDEDWDTKSAQSSDNEDQFSYRIDYNAARSSLFDNEPPSLGPNDSSGIVRDANITRQVSIFISLYFNVKVDEF